MVSQVVRTATAALLAGALALAGQGPAFAEPPDSLPDAAPPMEIGARPVRPIAAWSEFCHREPDACRISADEPERIVLDAASWRLVRNVNDEVNATLIPMTDRDHWGVEDVWGFPTDGIGDCEDFQLLKRRLLEAVGLPRRAMRMTVVIDDTGEGHAVLTILTDRGDLVLDNKPGFRNASPPVLHAADVGYRFVKREGSVPGPDGGPWVALGADPPPAATAVAEIR